MRHTSRLCCLTICSSSIQPQEPLQACGVCCVTQLSKSRDSLEAECHLRHDEDNSQVWYTCTIDLLQTVRIYEKVRQGEGWAIHWLWSCQCSVLEQEISRMTWGRYIWQGILATGIFDSQKLKAGMTSPYINLYKNAFKASHYHYQHLVITSISSSSHSSYK